MAYVKLFYTLRTDDHMIVNATLLISTVNEYSILPSYYQQINIPQHGVKLQLVSFFFLEGGKPSCT